jgi:hypothetical protein
MPWSRSSLAHAFDRDRDGHLQGVLGNLQPHYEVMDIQFCTLYDGTLQTFALLKKKDNVCKDLEKT